MEAPSDRMRYSIHAPWQPSRIKNKRCELVGRCARAALPNQNRSVESLSIAVAVRDVAADAQEPDQSATVMMVAPALCISAMAASKASWLPPTAAVASER